MELYALHRSDWVQPRLDYLGRRPFGFDRNITTLEPIRAAGPVAASYMRLLDSLVTLREKCDRSTEPWNWLGLAAESGAVGWRPLGDFDDFAWFTLSAAGGVHHEEQAADPDTEKEVQPEREQ